MFKNDNNLIVNEEELLKYIKEKCNAENINLDNKTIEKILDFELEYLITKGIAK